MNAALVIVVAVVAAIVIVVVVDAAVVTVAVLIVVFFLLFCTLTCHLRTAFSFFFSRPLNFRYHVGRVVAELSDNEKLKLETISLILVSSDSKKN